MVYMWDEMTEKEHDWLLADAFNIVDKQGFDWAWESGTYSFTTKIEKSWIIIEKLQERNFFVHLACRSNSVDIYAPEDDEQKLQKAKNARLRGSLIKLVAMGYGKTMPEAISKTALKAVGIEIE